jgi:O-glycosyl hydrolase
MGFVLFFVLLEVVSSARVYVSNLAGFRLQHVATLEWHSSCASVQAMVLLNKTFQPVDGFGGSFLRSGALALSVLEEHEQEKVLKALFHPEEGAGLSVGKVPIGACDYCVLSFEQNVSRKKKKNKKKNLIILFKTTWWGYRENRSLPFSLGPDLELPGGTIPYIRRARQHMKDALLLQATMDYPPEWMLLGALPNATVNPAFYGELARYYLDYSKEFSKHAGFALRYLSLFNEPKDSYTYISTEEIADLLVNHVGPLFRSQSSVKLTYASQAGEKELCHSSVHFFFFTKNKRSCYDV